MADFKTKASRAAAGFLLVGGMTAGAAGIAGAQDGNGLVNIGPTEQNNTTDQENTQVQIEAPEQQQNVEQTNLQLSDQFNEVYSGSDALAAAGSGEEGESSVGDTSSDSSIGNSNLANSNPQDAANQNAQSQTTTGGNQANAPESGNFQDTDYGISDIGGDVDDSTNVDVENVLNGSGNVDASTNDSFNADLDIAVELSEALVGILAELLA